MVFSSLLFMFIFLPIFLLVHFIVPKKFRNLTIFIFSLIFYAWGEPIYVLIMLFSTVFDYSMGLIIHKYREDKRLSKAAVIMSIVVNLGMLGFFKYSGFFIENINNVFGLSLEVLKVALPIGISFYTFQTMSYTIDLYRGKIGVQRNIISFGAYVSMFPQLIAGPIVTYSEVEKEINNRNITVDGFSYGIERFIQGLGKKVILANNIGLVWESVKSSLNSEATIVMLWLGIIAFALQLYFDFSGYSDMAIGLGSMIGFKFPENFNYPYLSKSVAEFWRRWHITLGSWFREYVYIPLGGNRVSETRWLFNVIIVWFLTGFWHGAGWNFIVWGIYFAILMIIEKMFLTKLLSRLPSIISRVYLWIAILISWVFFSLDNIGEALIYLKGMFGFGSMTFINDATMYLISNNILFIVIGLLMATPLLGSWFSRKKDFIKVIVYGLILVVATAYLVDSTFNPFLYFRF